MDNKNSNKWAIPAAIIFAALLIGGALIYSTGKKSIDSQQGNGANQQQNQQANQPGNANQQQTNSGQASGPSIDSSDVVLGNANAPLTIIEFGDFQCPFCTKFSQEIEPQLRTNYIDTGKAKMVYKPLAFLDSQSQYKESQNAVAAVECAKEQGKFWDFHDAIFKFEYGELQKEMAGQLQTTENIGVLNRALFQRIAGDLKMDTNKFLSCYDSGKYANAYQTYMQEGEAAMPQGIGTPAVFVNGQKAELQINSSGQFDFNAFSRVLDGMLGNGK